MKANIALILVIIFTFFSGNSCSKNDDDHGNELLINQKLSAAQLTKLMSESMSIKELEDFTLVNSTTCNNHVLHEGESVQIKAEAFAKGIHQEIRLFYMREISDSGAISERTLEVRIPSVTKLLPSDTGTLVQSNDFLFDKLVAKIRSDSIFVFQTVVIGTVQSRDTLIDGVCTKRLFLSASDLYLP